MGEEDTNIVIYRLTQLEIKLTGWTDSIMANLKSVAGAQGLLAQNQAVTDTRLEQIVYRQNQLDTHMVASDTQIQSVLSSCATSQLREQQISTLQINQDTKIERLEDTVQTIRLTIAEKFGPGAAAGAIVSIVVAIISHWS